MQRTSLMPFFWTRLFAPAFLAGALVSGCAAGGGSLDGEGTGSPLDQGSSPTTSPPVLPNAAPPSAPPPAATPGNTNPAPGTPSAPADDDSAASGGGEVLPVPQRDDGAAPPAGDDNAGGGQPAPDDRDDDDDGDDDDGDDDDGDDDDGDDDDGDDDDGDDDDGDDDDDDDRDDDDGDDDDGDDDDDDAGVPAPDPDPAPNPGTPPVDALTFTADIRPILVTNCGRCHASGGLPNFASADAAAGYDVAFRERNEIIELIQDGEMPADTCRGAPGSNGCVSVADFELIRQWVAAGAPE